MTPGSGGSLGPQDEASTPELGMEREEGLELGHGIWGWEVWCAPMQRSVQGSVW